MKFTQLRYFMAICKYSNFTRAFNELHVSQPSLTNAIKELEKLAEISIAMLADDSFLTNLLYQRFKALQLIPNVMIKTKLLCYSKTLWIRIPMSDCEIAKNYITENTSKTNEMLK